MTNLRSLHQVTVTDFTCIGSRRNTDTDHLLQTLSLSCLVHKQQMRKRYMVADCNGGRLRAQTSKWVPESGNPQISLGYGRRGTHRQLIYRKIMHVQRLKVFVQSGSKWSMYVYRPMHRRYLSGDSVDVRLACSVDALSLTCYSSGTDHCNNRCTL